VATVEVTSETKDHPVESALLLSESSGWRAAQPGAQIIRLLFDHPLKVKRISLVFEETENTRTQEFVLRWSSDSGRSFREIVRQQWNFSPPGTVREVEDYLVDLSNVTAVEFEIVPDKSGGDARASLQSLRMA
jgi:nuclear transport factor 2 (NTF2) superfamily protein